MWLISQDTAKVKSVVLPSCDALAQQLLYADAEDLLLPGFTWHPDTLMVSLRHLVDCTKKELFAGAQTTQTTLTKLSIFLHLLPLFVGMRNVPLSTMAFRSLSTRAPAKGASAAAKCDANSSSRIEASGEEEESRALARNARPSAVVRATYGVLDALSLVVRIYDCGFQDLSDRKWAHNDASPI